MEFLSCFTLYVFFALQSSVQILPNTLYRCWICISYIHESKIELPFFFSRNNIRAIAQQKRVAAAAAAAAAAARSLQLCPTLCDRRDGSPPGSPVPGILQARTLERVAISFSNCHLLYSGNYKSFRSSVWEIGDTAPMCISVSYDTYLPNFSNRAPKTLVIFWV